MSDQDALEAGDPVVYEPVTFGGEGLHPEVRELDMHRIVHLSYEKLDSPSGFLPVAGKEG